MVRLRIYQSGALVAAISGIVATMLIYRHYTESIFTPAVDFVLSVNLAVPPFFVVAFTYAFYLLTGKRASESTETVHGFIRDKVFHSIRALAAITIVSVATIGIAIYVNAFVTPPVYERFVTHLLGGEEDDFKIVKEHQQEIQKVNPKLSSQFDAVIAVFQERQAINVGGKKPSSTRARILVRTLEANIDDNDWKDHPLRYHALGEAYSIFGDAAARGGPGLKPDAGRAKQLYEKSIASYEVVIASDDTMTTELMVTSAQNNIGNQYFYMNDMKNAVEFWRKANAKPSIAAWGNIIAGLVSLGKYDEAIEQGTRARKWAEESGKALQEASGYTGIIGNTGFAKWSKGDYEAALVDFMDAVALVDDKLNRLNFAFALILAGQRTEATKYLMTFVPPMTEDNQATVVQSSNPDYCGYLLLAIADKDATPSLYRARMYAALKTAKTAGELRSGREGEGQTLTKRIVAELPSSSGHCVDFFLLQETKSLVLGSVR